MKRFFKSLLLMLVVFALPLSLVACKKDDGGSQPATCPSSLNSAKSYIETLLAKNGEALAVSKCTAMPTTLAGGITFTWTVSGATEALVSVVDGSTAGTKALNVNSFPENDFTFKLNCKIEKETDNFTLTWNFNVAKFVPMTYAQVIACSKNDAVSFEGVVTQIISKSLNEASENDLFIENEGGAVMAYKMTEDPADLDITFGTKVQIKGTYSPYNGLAEFTNCSINVLTDTAAPRAPQDITTIVAAATSKTDSTLQALVGKYVEIKGVTVTDENTGSGYYNFELGNVQSYVRLSSSQKAITATETTTFKTNHAAKIGYKADVKGIVNLYSGAFYLTPCEVGAFTYGDVAFTTDQQKVDFVKRFASIDTTKVEENKDVSLEINTIFDGVTVTWVSNKTNAVVSNDNKKATFTAPDSAVTVKLTGTITCGTATATVEFEIVTKAVDPATLTSVTLTEAGLGLGAYAADEATKKITGFTFGYKGVGGYGDGIQFRYNNSNTGSSTIYNKDVFVKGIASIVFNWNTSKTKPKSGTNFIDTKVKVYFGNTADCTDYSVEITLSKDATDVTVYTATPDVQTYKYFKIEDTAAGAQFYSSIVINFAN